MMPGDLDGGCVTAERVRHAIGAGPVQAGQHALNTTASIGVACTSAYGYQAQELLHAADVALYLAKASGRNRVEVVMDRAALAG